MDQKKIGAFIGAARKEKGLTQEQLAEILEVSQRSVSRWETGATMPDYSMLEGICSALDINIAELLNAKKIEGSAVLKDEVTDTAKSLMSMAGSRAIPIRLVITVIAAAVMIAAMVVLYCSEFNISALTTAELENAINVYHFLDNIESDVLKSMPAGKHTLVLYGMKNYRGASGLARLEKGLFGRYRIVSCVDTNFRLINTVLESDGSKSYVISFCVNDLPEIDCFTVNGGEYRRTVNYYGSPFLTVIDTVDTAEISHEGFDPFETQYHIAGAEVSIEQLESTLSVKHINYPFSSYTSCELWTIYAGELLILLIGLAILSALRRDSTLK